VSDQQDGAGRLRKRFDEMLGFIGGSTSGRHTKEVEKFMLRTYGVTPKTCRKYLDWGVQYGELIWTNSAHSRVKVIEV